MSEGEGGLAGRGWAGLALAVALAALALMPLATGGSVSFFGNASFAQGVFNNTYLNYSQSISSFYWPNNATFLGTGSYFTPTYTMNNSVVQAVSAVNWTWFEDMGYGANNYSYIDLHFENDSKDASPNNNSGVPINISSSSYVPNCEIGGCVFLNGSNQYYNVTNISPLSPQFFTITAWIKVQGNSTPGTQYIFYNGNTPDPALAINVSGGAGNVIASTCQTDLRIAQNATAVNIADGNWHQIVFAGNNSDNSLQSFGNIYVDGNPQGLLQRASGTCTGNSGSQPVYVGEGPSMGTSFNGSLDEFNIFNYTLNATQIKQNYLIENSAPTFIHNFTSVSLGVRVKDFAFNNSALVSWWDLGDSSGNETAVLESLDLSGNNNALAFIGNSSFNLGYPYLPEVNTTNAVIGNSVTLNGNNSYLTASDAPGFEYAGGNMTMSAWFYLSANAHAQYLITKPWNSNGQYNYQLYVNTGGGLYAQVFANTTFTARNNTAVSLNTWHQGVLSLNSNGSMVVYLDGNAISQNVTPGFGGNWTPGNGNQTKNLTIGTDYPYGTVGNAGMASLTLNGSMDDVKIWNRTLSAAEISSLYNNGCPTCTSGEESNWSTWSNAYAGGTALVTGVVGNIVQGWANLTTTSSEYSAFLNNVTITYTSTTTTTTSTTTTTLGGGPDSTFAAILCPLLAPDSNIQVNAVVFEGENPYTCDHLVPMSVSYPNGTAFSIPPANCTNSSGIRQYPAFSAQAAGNYNLSINTGFAAASCVITRTYWKAGNPVPDTNPVLVVALALAAIGAARFRGKGPGNRRG